ncbi:MAG: hypothetical protein FWH18_09535 [Marinilabiliaceae bacterium]|nr:hypothetical protein [Marinilabiliaceae bacterium]
MIIVKWHNFRFLISLRFIRNDELIHWSSSVSAAAVPQRKLSPSKGMIWSFRG